MPAAYFHEKLAKDIFIRFGEPIYIKENLSAYLLGAMGPNIYEYHQLLNPLSKSQLSSFCQVVHREKASEFIISLINYSKENVATTAYTLGYITHYVLDRTLNPYIISRTETPSGKFDIIRHADFENSLDVWLYREISPTGMPRVCEFLETLEISSQIAISRVLLEASNNAFDKHPLNMDYIFDTIGDMNLFHKKLYCESLSKYGFIQNIEGLFKLNGRYTNHLPNPVEPGYDFLNKSHNVWKVPSNLGQQNIKSVPELMNEANEFAYKLLSVAIDIISEDENADELIELINDIDYYGNTIII